MACACVSARACVSACACGAEQPRRKTWRNPSTSDVCLISLVISDLGTACKTGHVSPVATPAHRSCAQHRFCVQPTPQW